VNVSGLLPILMMLGSAEPRQTWDFARYQRSLTEAKAREGHACTVEHLGEDLAQLVRSWDLGTIRPGARVPVTLVEAAEQGEVEGRTLVPEEPFHALRTFRCDFPESEGRRISAKGTISPATRETFSDLVIDNVDHDQGTARFIGNAGSNPVRVFDGDMTITFLEQTMTGNVNVLSIFKRTAKIDTYKAVYSRHSAFTTGDLTMSQSYGACRALLAF
jgi:hypothetical protein